MELLSSELELSEAKNNFIFITNNMLDSILALEISILKIQKLDRTSIDDMNMTQWFRKLINRSETMLDNVSNYETFIHEFRTKLKSRFRLTSIV
jgi:hypothetical protein